jgi:hypothetical protein
MRKYLVVYEKTKTGYSAYEYDKDFENLFKIAINATLISAKTLQIKRYFVHSTVIVLKNKVH